MSDATGFARTHFRHYAPCKDITAVTIFDGTRGDVMVRCETCRRVMPLDKLERIVRSGHERLKH